MTKYRKILQFLVGIFVLAFIGSPGIVLYNFSHNTPFLVCFILGLFIDILIIVLIGVAMSIGEEFIDD